MAVTPEAFGTVLKDVQFQSSTVDLDRLARHSVTKQPSPAPSLSSCSSSDSKEGDLSTGKHFDPDVGSAGTLADVDTSDVTRQNSVEGGEEEEEPKSPMVSGLRRTLDHLFGLNKSKTSRKSPETENSSTDAEQPVKSKLQVARTAPPIPQQRFNQVARLAIACFFTLSMNCY